MSYQDRIDIDRLYDLVYDTQSEQLKVITREEFEQIVGSTRDLKDKMALYPDKSEVELEIFKILRDAGVITDDKYNELVGKIQIAQNTANIADDKATNAVGTANNAQRSATNALNGVDRIDGEIGDASTQGTIKYNVNQAKTQSSQAIQDSSVAKKDSSQALSNSKDALEGVDRIDGEIGDATTPNTIKYDVFNAKSDSTEALGKSNRAISDSSDALDLAETVDGKANQLRTDVGTVNQPNDGSLQQQITYLPSYISKLVVSEDGRNWQNVAHLNLGGTGWIGAFPSELAHKQLRDDNYIEYTVEITDPDNIVSTYTDRITSYVTFIRQYTFGKNGIYIIACENLKCVVAVGDYTKEHFHTISEVTNLQSSLNGKANSTHSHSISQVTNLQTSLNGKANSIHSHSISDVDDLQMELGSKADILHFHDISDVTNLQTSLDGKANSTHSHSISNITNLQSSLDAKQNKSNYSLIADVTSSGQTNGSVKLYSDGLDVLIQISGTFQNVNANGNTTIGTVTSPDYLPSMDYAISNNASIQADRQTKCWIRKSDGAVALSNGTSSTTITIYAQIRYPLKSRMP